MYRLRALSQRSAAQLMRHGRVLSQRTASAAIRQRQLAPTCVPVAFATQLQHKPPNIAALQVSSFSTKDKKDAKEAKPALGVPYGKLTIGVPKETFDLERRVSQTPESVGKLVESGFKVVVERGAGAGSTFSDAMYEKAGATIVDGSVAWGADIVTHIRPPTPAEAALVGNRTLCSMIWPAQVSPSSISLLLCAINRSAVRTRTCWRS